MDNRPIGIFDSGLGGLTVVKQLINELPDENIVYFGDTGRVPYGTRTKDTIIKYTKQDINFLQSLDVKFIISACGTASAVALNSVAADYSIPMVGVVGAACNAAIAATYTGRIGVIATNAAINSRAYEKNILELAPSSLIFTKACPLFVPLVENGYFKKGDPVTTLVAKEYLKPIIAGDVDTLILGCTHYPLLEDIIAEIVGNKVTLIDAGKETARTVAKNLEEKGVGGKREYFVSDEVDGFANLAGIFLGVNIDSGVKRIDIEKY
jgi:glutamate racemase